MRMPFGKFRGEDVCELPDWYLSWITANIELRDPLRAAIEEEVQFREGGCHHTDPNMGWPVLTLRIEARDGMLVRDIFERGFHAAARASHPDAGGDHNVMVRLNHVAESIREQFREIA